jgi:glycosyltransferase involved in cell wall biosynthesis
MNHAPILHVKEVAHWRHESRMLKESAAALRHGVADRIVIAGRWLPGLAVSEQVAENITFHRIPMMRGSSYPVLMPIRRWDAGRRLLRFAREVAPSLIECHEIWSLEWACQLRRWLGVPLIYTPHELETERNGLMDPAEKARERAMERRLLRECDAVVCVSEEIADWYAAEYAVTRPWVVRNVPEVPAGWAPRKTDALHRRFNLDPDALVFLYQGNLCAGRRIEQFLRVFTRAQPDRHVVFMGYGELEGRIKEAAVRHPNIHFMPAVPPAEVVVNSAAADVGLVGVENVCLSYISTLPNKLFEYLLAGVPPMLPDYPAMRRTVEQCPGAAWLVPEDDDAWLAAVNRVTRADIDAHRTASAGAGALFSWRDEESRLIAAYRQALARGPRRANPQ